MKHELTEQQQALYEEAQRYEASGDHYNAIKLYKLLSRECPQWKEPWLKLGHSYKYRMEWKPTLYLHKRAVALDVANRQAWWNIGLAATALGKLRQARRVWEKFGWSAASFKTLKPVSVRLQIQKQFEVLWVQRVSPCLGYIRSIPQPASGRRYGDLVLVDNEVRGYHSNGVQRLPIYDEMGLKKRSHYGAYSCLLLQATPNDVKILQDLCIAQNLGFEVWGNTSMAATIRSAKERPEYFTFEGEAMPELGVAIAAKYQEEAVRVLKNWEVISLKHTANFQAH